MKLNQIRNKTIEGRSVICFPVDRKEDFGPGDCAFYEFTRDGHMYRDLRTFVQDGVDMELEGTSDWCEKKHTPSQDCVKKCDEFCVSGTVPGTDLGKHVPSIDTGKSYFIYYQPKDTGNCMIATSLQNGQNVKEAEEALKFISRNLDAALI